MSHTTLLALSSPPLRALISILPLSGWAVGFLIVPVDRVPSYLQYLLVLASFLGGVTLAWSVRPEAKSMAHLDETGGRDAPVVWERLGPREEDSEERPFSHQ